MSNLRKKISRQNLEYQHQPRSSNIPMQHLKNKMFTFSKYIECYF